MAITYDSIATTTLGSTQSSVTFSSISQSYTDIRFVISTKSASGAPSAKIQLNGNTGSVYNWASLYGNGNQPLVVYQGDTLTTEIMLTGGPGLSDVTNTMYSVDILNYTSTPYKSVLITESGAKSGAGTAPISMVTGGFFATGAISSVTFFTGASGFATGSVFSLYGILKA
jgi:hypothetical protein